MVLKMQHGGFAGDSGLGGLLQPSPPSTFPVGGGGDLASVGSEDQLRLEDLLARRGPGLGYNNRPMPLPDFNIRPPNFIGIQPQPPMLGNPIFGGLQPMPQPAMPDYSSQFEKFGEQLTGFGDQMTGYQDALGSFNEQVGGMGKQFETITNRLDSVDKGLGSLGNQIASLENMQKAQPQEVMQPQRPAFNPFGFGGFGGLGSLFGRRY